MRAKRSASSQQVTTRHIKQARTKAQQTQDRKKQHKRSTKEVPPRNGQPNTTLETQTDPRAQQPHPQRRRGPRHMDVWLARKTPTHQRIIYQNISIKTQKGEKAKTSTQQQTKRNTGAKEIQQANPGVPEKQQKQQAPPPHQQKRKVLQ